MNKDNKYYNLIETLVKNHKKFPGYEAILDDIIDDVFSHSEVIIGSIDNESVIKAYLQKVISTSIITVPKQLNFHNELKHRTISATPEVKPAEVVEPEITAHQEENSYAGDFTELANDLEEEITEQTELLQDNNDDELGEIAIAQDDTGLEVSSYEISEAEENAEITDEMSDITGFNEEAEDASEKIEETAEEIEEEPVQKANPIYVDKMINTIESDEISSSFSPKTESENDTLYEELNETLVELPEEEDTIPQEIQDYSEITFEQSNETTEEELPEITESPFEDDTDETDEEISEIASETDDELVNISEEDTSEETEETEGTLIENLELVSDNTTEEAGPQEEEILSVEEDETEDEILTEEEEETNDIAVQEDEPDNLSLSLETPYDDGIIHDEDSEENLISEEIPQVNHEEALNEEQEVSDLTQTLSGDLSETEESEPVALEDSSDIEISGDISELSDISDIEIGDDFGEITVEETDDLISSGTGDDLLGDNAENLGLEETTIEEDFGQNVDNTIEELPDFDIGLSEDNQNKTEEADFSFVDYSVFDYTPDNKNEYDNELGSDLLKLNNERPELHILDIFNLRFKQNMKVNEIAKQLNIEPEAVVDALNEMVKVV